MRQLVFNLLAIVVCSFPAFAEIVRTTDGRSIELRDDGTYEFVEAGEQSDSAFVEHQDPYFIHHIGEYEQKRVRFMPIYKNASDRRIIGVKFTARFLNAFGS